MPGPLEGLTVLELGTIGPVPFAAMLLADLGADVIRVERVGGDDGVGPRRDLDPVLRNRRSIAVDLKHPDGVGSLLLLVEQVDVVLEGFRPGVAERLGVGPEECLKRNPGVVVGRMTGWGQDGPNAHTAGHDINYIALTGALNAIGRRDEAPLPPLNLVGDYGGGSMFLVFGVLAALFEKSRSGQGQVIDAAMIDGAAVLMTLFYGMLADDRWKDERGVNVLDTGAPYYATYETSDGKYIALGSIEPQFYRILLTSLDLAEDPLFADQNDRTKWPGMAERLREEFLGKTRQDWCDLLEATDACFAPVLSMQEAPQHPQMIHRRNFIEVEGMTQPAPAPKFSRTPAAFPTGPVVPGRDTADVLSGAGFSAEEIAALRAARAVE